MIMRNKENIFCVPKIGIFKNEVDLPYKEVYKTAATQSYRHHTEVLTYRHHTEVLSEDGIHIMKDEDLYFIGEKFTYVIVYSYTYECEFKVLVTNDQYEVLEVGGIYDAYDISDTTFENNDISIGESFQIICKHVSNTFVSGVNYFVLFNVGIKPKDNNNKLTIKNNKDMKNSMINKIKDQFLPKEEVNIRLTINGDFCVCTEEGYISIDADNELTSYPEELVLDLPAYSIRKPINNIKAGDIIKHGNTFGKVITSGKTLKVLTFEGTEMTKKPIKDFILNNNTIPVLFNFVNGMNDQNGMNMMMMLMMDRKGGFDKDAMMMAMMMNQSQNNGMNQMNPMMMLLLGKDEGGDSDIFETMMLMNMMNGENNPFGNIINKTEEDK